VGDDQGPGLPTPASGAAIAQRPLVLIVPNFSEGRRPEVMDAIVGAMTAVAGITLLNRQADPDHNRLDASLIGTPAAVRAAALAGAQQAVRLIDMDQHHGSHPRMGAVDVLPFIPIRGVGMDDCVALAREVAAELADTLSLPVYLYERAATRPERASLADVRRGEYEGLRADVAAGRRLPDLGPPRLGRAGATAVGARPPLVAFNVNLTGVDERAAKAVARRVRERSGGLVHVRAIGLAVAERGCVQVSMNLVDPLATPPYRALELVRLEAARFGMQVLDTEVVGLIPQAALAESAAHYLQLRGFDPDAQVIETLVARLGGDGGSAPPDEGIGGHSVAGFLDGLASSDPTPGGGAVAAVSGAAGAALLAMVARLTSGRRGYEALAGRMGEVVRLAEAERRALLLLADRDAEAFDSVMSAHRLPRRTDEERAARSAAVQGALVEAAAVPLEVARRAAALLPVARELVETGNANAVSDALSAAQLLHAAVGSALANVALNAASISDAPRAESLDTDARALSEAAERLAGEAGRAFTDRLRRSA
jgi:glutamate formiminotransferase/formiminotetrahydrofolate cyclodeaminase